MLILGIETSCDETAAAIVKDGRTVLSNIVFSQIEKHKEWGGVIPEVASRLHLESINSIVNESISKANSSWDQIGAIAITNKPGLIGSLLVGVNVAKTLAWIHQKPLIPVNHLYGHVCANFIDSDVEPPFICLLASGGHTQIIKVQGYNDMQVLGETIDDAAGEAFDKVARLMSLPYPGGPHLDKLAQSASNLDKYSFPIAKVEGLDFSFSGLKTAVLRLKQKIGEAEWEKDKADIAYAFQDCIAQTFYNKIKESLSQNCQRQGLRNDEEPSLFDINEDLMSERNAVFGNSGTGFKAIFETGVEKIVLAGGVAANSRIREVFKENFSEANLFFPSLKYCTDNAAMIASAGYFIYSPKNDYQDLGFEVFSRASNLQL